MHANALPPLIVTAQLPPGPLAFFDALRKAHFPAHLNHLTAHLTLFHALPNTADTKAIIEANASATAPINLHVVGPVSIGKGVAYKIDSNELKRLHKELKKQLQEHLTPQDSQNIWPHITVQNKVDVAEAKALLIKLQSNFKPYSFSAMGLQVWAYLNGPWELVATYPFSTSYNGKD